MSVEQCLTQVCTIVLFLALFTEEDTAWAAFARRGTWSKSVLRISDSHVDTGSK